MVTTIKDDEGRVIALCEWVLVGKSGYEMETGEYIFVREIWVHESERYSKKINLMIDEIMALVPQARYGYFTRGKYGDRIKMFTREQWERRRSFGEVRS